MLLRPIRCCPVCCLYIGSLSLLAATPQAQADDKVLRVGTLKLIHGITPYFLPEVCASRLYRGVVPFESPTDGKNAC